MSLSNHAIKMYAYILANEPLKISQFGLSRVMMCGIDRACLSSDELVDAGMMRIDKSTKPHTYSTYRNLMKGKK